MSSNSTSSSSTRSISQVISSLRTSFRDVDFKEAEKELRAREAKLRSEKAATEINLRDKYDTIETECSDLRLKVLRLEEERRRLMREWEINDDRLKDSARELSVMKEKEKKAIERRERLMADIMTMEQEKDKLLQNLEDAAAQVIELKRCLREKEEEVVDIVGKCEVLEMGKMEAEAEVDGLRREIKDLEVARLKYDAHLLELRRKDEEKDASLKEAYAELERVRKENVDLVGARAKMDDYLEEEARKVAAQKEEIINEIRKKYEDQLEGLQRKFEVLEAAGNANREKDEMIEELRKKVEDLEREKKELLTKNEGLKMDKEEAMAKYENQVLKLEEDVVNWMCLNVARDKSFAGSQIGKVLSEIIQALESQDGATCNAQTNKDGDFQEGGVSHIVHSKCSPEPDMKLEETVRKTLDFGTEVSKTIGATCIKKAASCGIIVLSDSDNDNEAPLSANVLKRKRAFSGGLRQRGNVDDSNCSLNPDHRVKILTDLPHELSKHNLSISASSGSCNKFATSQCQNVATVRKCNEILERNSMEPRGFFDVDNSLHNERNTSTDPSCTPQAKELIANLRRKRAK